MRMSYLYIERKSVRTNQYDIMQGAKKAYVYLLTNDGVEFGRLDTAGKFGFGTPTPTARMHVVPTDSASVGLKVCAVAGQTADLLSACDESGATKFRVAANGNLVIPAATMATGSPGVAGQLAFDETALYVRTSVSGWKKINLSVIS